VSDDLALERRALAAFAAERERRLGRPLDDEEASILRREFVTLPGDVVLALAGDGPSAPEGEAKAAPQRRQVGRVIAAYALAGLVIGGGLMIDGSHVMGAVVMTAAAVLVAAIVVTSRRLETAGKPSREEA